MMCDCGYLIEREHQCAPLFRGSEILGEEVVQVECKPQGKPN